MAIVISSSNSDYIGTAISFTPIAITDSEITVNGVKTVAGDVSVSIPSVSGGTNVAGDAGYSSNLRISGGYIQYRQEATATVTDWTNLIATSTFTGATGATGAAGTNGLALTVLDAGVSVTDSDFTSIVGRSPSQYDCLLNTNGGDKVLYIRTAVADTWTNLGSIVGSTGAAGTDADNVQYEYQDADSGWTGVANSYGGTEKWIRVSLDGGSTWSSSIKFVGDDGSNGSNGSNGNDVSIEYSATGTGNPTTDPGEWDSTFTDGVDKYIIFSTDNGSTWGSAGQFVGDTGDTVYLYVAYASDNVGTGWNLTPSGSLKYRAEVQSTTYYNPINSTQFNALSPTWIKYIGDDGSNGSDGDDGDQWTHGTGVPSDATVLTYDIYYIDDATGDVYKKAQGASIWTLEFNIIGASGDQYKDSSSTSVDLSALVVDTNQAITVTAGYSWSLRQLISVVYDDSNYFLGEVVTYSSTTLTLRVKYIVGTSTQSSWTVNLSGSTYPLVHASEHEAGGSDLLQHDNLTGFVANEHINWVGGAATENFTTSGDLDVGNISTSGYVDIDEISTPGNPSANIARFYCKDDSGTTKLYFRDNAGNETEIGGGGSLTAPGSDTELLYNNGGIIDAISSVTWDGSELTVTQLDVTTLQIGNTSVTSTAAELNVLDGYSGSVTELNYLKDVYDTGVTSSELNYLDGTDVTNQRILHGNGTYITNTANFIFDSTNLSIPSGGVYKINGTQITTTDLLNVTATAAEVNYLDGTDVTDQRILHGNGTYITNTANFIFDGTNVSIPSGGEYRIDGTKVIDATSLGAAVVSSSLTSVGTIATGTWQGTDVGPEHGGTGVSNGANNTVTFTGNYTLGITLSNNTSITLPTSGTLLVNVVEDTTPQLGGDLDLNGNNIDFPTTADISDCLDEDTMVSDSATSLATQQSIKAYVDNSLSNQAEVIQVACSDEATNLTTGTEKITFRMPFAMTVSEVRANVNTAPVGSTIIVDINESGSSILSTKLTIDASEKTSTTAATPAVISDSSLADDAEITIDIDQIGSGTAGKGLKVTLIGTRT